MSSLPTVINWRNGKVTLNHDHLKAEMCDKPVGKVMAWGTCQDHVEFGDSHLIPADMWMWSCVDVFSLLEYKPLPNKRSLWASSIVLLPWVHGHYFGFCLLPSVSFKWAAFMMLLLTTDKSSFSFKFLWLLIQSLVYGFYYIFKQILRHTWQKRVILSLTVLDNSTSDNTISPHCWFLFHLPLWHAFLIRYILKKLS